MRTAACWIIVVAPVIVLAASERRVRKDPAYFKNAEGPAEVGPHLTAGNARRDAARSVPRGLDLYMQVPVDNPLTDAKIDLGRQLFFDKQLSRDETISCATCHDPRRAFTNGESAGIGIAGQRGTRNVPSLVNRGYGASFFWDGRAPSLEAQVLEPIGNPRELGMQPEHVVVRLTRHESYRDRFRTAFSRAINVADLARALASYVRSIVSGDAPVDRYMDRSPDALSERAKIGFKIFQGKGNCWLCHTIPTFSDEKFHNTGVAWQGPALEPAPRPRPPFGPGVLGAFTDLGRFVATGNPHERGAFKTPMLREVARTAPYMHDGSFRTLEAVVDFYSDGGRKNPNLDADIRPLRLTTDEKRALVAFLKSLSGRIRS